MLYDNFINDIISQRGQWGVSKDTYFEMHHIIPKCMGGTGDGFNNTFKKYSTHQNCIWLTAREHFIAHKLLAEKYPDNHEVVRAYCFMAHKRNGNEVTAEEYEYAKLLRKSLPGTRLGMPVSIETRQRLSESHKGQITWMKGKTHTEEAKQKNREAHLGKPSANKGKKLPKTTGGKNGNSKVIIDETTGIIYESLSDAARAINGQLQGVSRSCRGVLSSYYGHAFRYYKEETLEK